MSGEARITELQREADSLRRQVGELKELLEVELEHIRDSVQFQLSEAREFLVHRESQSMSRIVQLEAEVVKLTRICEQATRTEEFMNASIGFGTAPKALVMENDPRREKLQEEIINSDDTAGNHTVAAAAAATDASKLCTGRKLSMMSPTSTAENLDIDFALSDLQPRLDRIYDFYTVSSLSADSELLHPAMHLVHFTAMARDAGLDRGHHAFPPQLLWMAVMRNLSPPTRTLSSPARRRGSTLLLPCVYRDDSALLELTTKRTEYFAHERHQSVERRQFAEALHIVYGTLATLSRSISQSPRAFRSFLLDDFLPAVERRIRQRPASSFTQCSFLVAPGVDGTSASTSLSTSGASKSSHTLDTATHCLKSSSFAEAVPAYEADRSVVKVIHQFSPRLARAFRQAAHGGPKVQLKDVRMNVEGFVDLVRTHQLLPLISRLQLKHVFVFCLETEAHISGNNATDDCIAYAAFLRGLYCVAEIVYGGSLELRQQYPSPYARLSKLLVKMFVL